MFNNFVSEVRQLQAKGRHLRQLHNFYQALGLVTSVTGAGAALASTGAIIPLGVGMAMYGASVLSERQRTGKLALLPFSSEDLGTVASQSLAGVSPASLPVRDTHYLSLEDKALLYLVSEQGPRLSQLADNLDDEQFDYVVTRLTERLMQHEGFLNNPNGIETARVKAGEIPADYYFQDALNYLPHEAKGLIPAGMINSTVAVSEIAPDLKQASSPSAETAPVPATHPPLCGEDFQNPHHTKVERTDWQTVFALIKDQDTYPAIVIIGAQGKGKTTLVNYLLSILNAQKIVLDPHYKLGTWPGCRVIGAGMDYDAVGEALANISADVKARYFQRSTVAGYQPMPVTLVLEEQTNWVDNVAGAAKFLKQSLSDIRKVGYRSISVAHGETNAARGGASGTAKMRKAGELSITLVEKGLAKVSLKDRETFLLRYPDPTPFTHLDGAPVMAAGGDLGPGFYGVDDPAPQPSTSTQSVLDVTVVQSEVTSGTLNRWDKFRAQSESHPHVIAMADWLERRTGREFTLKQLGDDKKLRRLFSAAGSSPKQGLFVFLHHGFISKVSDKTYQVAA